MVNADGSNLTRITELNGWISGEPQWSPDGSKITFHSIHNSTPSDPPTEGPKIYTVNADGSELTVLTGEGFVYPCWSPDGSKILYTSGVYGSHSETEDIYVMNADGTSKVKIASISTTAPMTPQWSPSGNQILFANQIKEEN